ncbi:carboxypeptidase-like regulatory domain-containing protein [Cystobacter fuscus]
MQRAPVGPTGIVTGVVTDASTGAPLAGTRVVAEGPYSRETVTDAEGRYSLTLPVGTYHVSATLFGYERQSVEGVVTEGGVVRLDFAPRPVPVHTVSGRVLDTSGAPIAFARVTLPGTPLPTALTDAAGTGVSRACQKASTTCGWRRTAASCRAPSTWSWTATSRWTWCRSPGRTPTATPAGTKRPSMSRPPRPCRSPVMTAGSR